jgi:lipoate-protein ligase A
MEFLKKNENFKIGKFKEALIETFFELDKSFKNEEVKKELEKYYEELKP